jgi:molybdopterin biosynthesis enzyme
VVLLHRAGHAAHHQDGLGLVGLVDLHGLEAAGQRRVLLDVLLVLGPGGGADGAQLPRASAGLSRLAASPVPAAPPAPTSVCVSSMNRMIGLGLACTSSITAAQALLELALHAGAGLQQAHVQRAQLHVLQARRHVAARDALREAFHHRGLADTGLADQDGVVLAPPHQDVDDLADLVVAADDGVHLAARPAR